MERKKLSLRISAVLMALIIVFCSVVCYADTSSDKTTRIFFTHDIHSYLEKAPQAAAIIKQKGAELGTNYFYVDAGDFSQGTLYQTGYEERALELGLLSILGCVAACPGNHEWDHAGNGFARMLSTAMKNYENLPMMLCANIDFSGELNDEQKNVKDTLLAYNKQAGNDSSEYMIYQADNGVKFGIFGLSGYSSIEDSPTAGMKWEDYISAAKRVSAQLKDKCDVIIALSHCGTNGRGEGEDAELAKAVPEIDLIISGHSHTKYDEPIMVGDTLIASEGCYLESIGYVDVSVDASGSVSFSNYNVENLSGGYKDDLMVVDYLSQCKRFIANNYLAPYDYEIDEKLAHCGFDFISLDEMYATHQEYPMGNLIADSYIYEAEKNGIDDIDVALVGLGTIRGSFTEGDISVSDAFQICSLGVGADGSAGHPILGAYITGKELKLMVELDASLGPMVSSIKMSYSGLRYKFNTKRMLLDRVTEVFLVDKNGNDVEIEDDKLYKVSCNMYAANMLGMLNGLTKGILAIVPKYADGTPVEDFYTCSLMDTSGNEIKEWYAFADYINSFDKGKSGLPEIPDNYKEQEGRKYKYAEGGFAVISHPGLSTILVGVVGLIVLLILFGIYKLIRKIFRKSKAKRV